MYHNARTVTLLCGAHGSPPEIRARVPRPKCSNERITQVRMAYADTRAHNYTGTTTRCIPNADKNIETVRVRAKYRIL